MVVWESFDETLDGVDNIRYQLIASKGVKLGIILQ